MNHWKLVAKIVISFRLMYLIINYELCEKYNLKTNIAREHFLDTVKSGTLCAMTYTNLYEKLRLRKGTGRKRLYYELQSIDWYKFRERVNCYL